jgi:hypothetical protein
VCARENAQGAVVRRGVVQVEPEGQHLLENGDRRLDMWPPVLADAVVGVLE